MAPIAKIGLIMAADGADEDVAEYFHALAAPFSASMMVRSTRDKGHAIFATSRIKAGSIILRDAPLCWTPTDPPSDACCSRCSRFLGSVREQLRRIGEEYGVDAAGLPPDLPLLGLESRSFPAHVAVPECGSAGGWTCCDGCAARMRLDLVDGAIDPAEWSKLARQLSVSGSPFFLLAAQLVREVVVRYAVASAQDRASGLPLRPLRGLVSPAELQAATPRAELQSSLRAVRACFRRAAARWPELVSATAATATAPNPVSATKATAGSGPASGTWPVADGLLSLRTWTACVGAMRANAIRAAVPSPLVLFMDAAQRGQASSAEMRLLTKQVWPFLQRVQRRYAETTGAGGAGESSSGEGGESGGGREGGSSGGREADGGDGDSNDGDSDGDGSGGEGGSETGSSSADDDQDETIFFSWGSLPSPMAHVHAASTQSQGQGVRPENKTDGRAVSVSASAGGSAAGGTEAEAAALKEEEEKNSAAAPGAAGEPGPMCVSSRLFASREGVAVFPLLSLLNHACRPNAQVCAQRQVCDAPGCPMQSGSRNSDVSKFCLGRVARGAGGSDIWFAFMAPDPRGNKTGPLL